MFGPPGHAYVYRSYGLHWCLNAVCREAGHGAAVLIRALQPTDGVAAMCQRRGSTQLRLLAAGPGRVCQALAVDRSHDGLPLDAPPFAWLPPGQPMMDIVSGPRIGIRQAAELPWRFAAAGSPFLSRPLRA